MASDPPQLGVEGIALANELSQAYTRVPATEPSPEAGGWGAPLCLRLKLGYQESRKQSVSRYRQGRSDAEDVFRCVVFKSIENKGFTDETAYRAAVRNHVRAGFALSDYFCQNFFERAAEHSGRRRFARNTTNDVGALVSTVLALASAGSGLTGGIGAGFGLADSGWRNYDENFLISTDLANIQGLVVSEQDRLRDRLKKDPDAMPDNFPDATNLILRYANLCSFVGMKELLSQSVKEKTEDNNGAAGNAPAQPISADLVAAGLERFMADRAKQAAKDAATKAAAIAKAKLHGR